MKNIEYLQYLSALSFATQELSQNLGQRSIETLRNFLKRKIDDPKARLEIVEQMMQPIASSYCTITDADKIAFISRDIARYLCELINYKSEEDIKKQIKKCGEDAIKLREAILEEEYLPRAGGLFYGNVFNVYEDCFKKRSDSDEIDAQKTSKTVATSNIAQLYVPSTYTVPQKPSHKRNDVLQRNLDIQDEIDAQKVSKTVETSNVARVRSKMVSQLSREQQDNLQKLTEYCLREGQSGTSSSNEEFLRAIERNANVTLNNESKDKITRLIQRTSQTVASSSANEINWKRVVKYLVEQISRIIVSIQNGIKRSK